MTVNISEMLNGDINRMAYTYRFSSVVVNKQESVAEHSWFVNWYSLLIAMDAAEYVDVDLLVLFSRGIIHDMDESVSGDCIRSFKYGSKKLKKEMEKVARLQFRPLVEKVVGKKHTKKRVRYIMEYWDVKEFTVEQFILKLADFLTVLMFAVREHELGNRKIERILLEVAGYIKQLFEEKTPKKLKKLAKNYRKQIKDMYTELGFQDVII